MSNMLKNIINLELKNINKKKEYAIELNEKKWFTTINSSCRYKDVYNYDDI